MLHIPRNKHNTQKYNASHGAVISTIIIQIKHFELLLR